LLAKYGRLLIECSAATARGAAFTKHIVEYNSMTPGGFDRDYHRVRYGSTRANSLIREAAMLQRSRILGLGSAIGALLVALAGCGGGSAGGAPNSGGSPRFFYAIRDDKTGELLFMGIMQDPS
jgi:hypothetical protein